MTVSACRWHSLLTAGDPAPHILFAHLLALGRRSSLTNFKSGNMKASHPPPYDPEEGKPRARETFMSQFGSICASYWPSTRGGEKTCVAGSLGKRGGGASRKFLWLPTVLWAHALEESRDR